MFLKRFLTLIAVGLLALPLLAQDPDDECDMEPDEREYTSDFDTDQCRFRNRYFHFEQPHSYWIMEPGWQVVLEGEDDGEEVRLEVTVLAQTEWVAGVRTRVIEEREFIDGELYEVSRNFFAICSRTNDIYYFGEDVDFYEDGEIVGHDGAWRAGVDGATPGVIMPGTPLIGARFHQEFAPDIAEDRAEIVAVGPQTLGDDTFEDVVVMIETSPLDGPCDYSIKYFAKGLGMIRDDDLEIVEAGFVFRLPPNYGFKQ